jgi:glycosyltransferase involved in cell wall biosynthesis
MISVIIPTIRVREEAGWLDRCLDAYEKTTHGDWEPIVIRDKPTCGIAWNEGIAKARGRYIHLTADDIEPLSCWDKAGIESADRGELPAARILNTDGTLQSCGTDANEHDEGEEATIARIPFGTREQFDKIGPMLEVHYQTDQWFSHRGRQVGYPTIVRRNYAFYHHFAPEGRLDSRLSADVRYYHKMGGE